MAWLIERARSKVAHLSHGVDLLPLCGAENRGGLPYREVVLDSSTRPVCTACASIVRTMMHACEARAWHIENPPS